MNSVLSIFLTSCCYTAITTAGANVFRTDLKVELVQVLFRHGARTPEQAEIDVCDFTLAEMYEPLGLGLLTHHGKRQEYEFGKFLRNRYDGYLSRYYEPRDVYAYASAIARTQMSLQLVLGGLYETRYPVVWNSELHWSPVPYISYPRELNILLESHKTRKFKELMNAQLNSNEFVGRFAKFSQFFNFIKARTMIKDNNILSNMDSTFDVLIANEYMRLPLPDWYTPEVKQTFIEIEETYRDAYVSTPELRRLGPGPMIKTFVRNMNLDGNYKNPRKIYLYGGHDSNVAMFTRAHNITQFRYPQFGSAVILEKLSDEKGRVYVRLLAWNGEGNIMTLKLGDHEEFCPIEDYLKIVKDAIPSTQEVYDLIGDLTEEKIHKILFEDDEVTETEV